MTTALGGARADDCNSLKESGLTYAACEIGQESLVPHISLRTSKDASRGFQHPQIGRLLCPAKFLIDFDADSAECVQIVPAYCNY